ncbi:MAG: nucleotidyltransferase domain-containing protein [Candidatus Rokuibacteriota bacterium]
MLGERSDTPRVVDWDAGDRRRRRLEAELARIVAVLPGLGVKRAIVFGSAARGDVRGQSDLDLILIADSREPFAERCGRFYGALKPLVGLDLLVYTPEEFEEVRAGRFLAQALADSRTVYEG